MPDFTHSSPRHQFAFAWESTRYLPLPCSWCRSIPFVALGGQPTSDIRSGRKWEGTASAVPVALHQVSALAAQALPHDCEEIWTRKCPVRPGFRGCGGESENLARCPVPGAPGSRPVQTAYFTTPSFWGANLGHSEPTPPSNCRLFTSRFGGCSFLTMPRDLRRY